MKIKFCQLPEKERKEILDNIEKFTKDRDKAQQMVYNAQNRLEEAKFHLETNNRNLQLIRDKYDFE